MGIILNKNINPEWLRLRDIGRARLRSGQARIPRRPITPPTIPQMAAHFTKAMLRWAKKGFKTVSKDEYMKRRLVCYQCQPMGRCPHCGCSLWAKAALVTEKCPEDKWK